MGDKLFLPLIFDGGLWPLCYDLNSKETTDSMATKPQKNGDKKAAIAPRRTAKWDCLAAEREYIADHKQSFRTISEKYGVAEKTVERYAAKHEWVKRRHEVAENAMQQFDELTEKDIAQANNEHIAYYKQIEEAGAEALEAVMSSINKNGEPPDTDALRAAAQTLKMGIEGRRVVMGLPTMVSSFADKNGKTTMTPWADAVQAARDTLRNAEQKTANADS